MPLNPRDLLEHDFPEIEQATTPRDASLYALSIGLGDRPLDPRRLRFVHENGIDDMGFTAAPIQPVTMGFHRWVLTPGLGIDVPRVVHGEERLTLHGDIPTRGTIQATLRVVGVSDKGLDRGALVSTRRSTFRADSDTPFATVETVTFCRGDGGCGSAGRTEPLGAPPPDERPDETWSTDIRDDAALLYRLCGDANPLHVDPAYAARAGFARPILHGLCSFAIATRPLWQDLDDPGDVAQVACRFAAPVFPGDRLDVEIWRRGRRAHFRGSVRGRPVLQHGTATFRH